MLGCGSDPVEPTPNDILKLLDTGKSSIARMSEAGLERDYMAIEEDYVVLRRCYIDIAEKLQEVPAEAEKKRILLVLSEWEVLIRRFREAKQAATEPISEETIESGRELSKDALKEIEAVYGIDQGEKDRREQEWKKAEIPLDEAIEKIRLLRRDSPNPSNHRLQTDGQGRR